jgi:hypothetical protein
MAAPPLSNADHSVAFGCLLHLFPVWYGKADSRHTSAVTNRLVEVWRERAARDRKANCYDIAKEIEDELKLVLDAARQADER